MRELLSYCTVFHLTWDWVKPGIGRSLMMDEEQGWAEPAHVIDTEKVLTS